ncbi:hypothetical protein GCM10010156_67410 [Planobispora rosea]|uniref:Adenosylcobinamide-GDP ribazoletransferase n=1 Tax=Planobispora rosea TaxID=35762 RepID=A0A8J3SAH4_PLARO|nr:adenosylcobinamide-GDP ribazoletransferase [Planobispora rosea]GGS99853.1 hypothetical protein GCM10010156_67410 [Planobispora rosea]GIH88104.1 hypothetical protein Pro02_65120 [Planobispora rosea]
MPETPPPENPENPGNAEAPDGPSRPSTLADGFRLAIGTLSVLPVRPGTVDRRAGGRAMALAPLVGAVLGGIAAAVLTAALWLEISPLLSSALAVGTLALLTRALHLDGLADLADGLGSGRPAERALDIMKRSDIGPFGVVTLVLTLLVQTAALTEAVSAGFGPPALVAACVAGRLALTWACREHVPGARPGGLGATVAGTVRRGPALAATALSLTGVAAVTFLFCFWILGPSSSGHHYLSHSPEDAVLYDGSYAPLRGAEMSEAYAGALEISSFPEGVLRLPQDLLSPLPALLPVVACPLAVVAGLLAASALRRRAVRRLGGITGDVLGALVETATAAALVVCVMV